MEIGFINKLFYGKHGEAIRYLAFGFLCVFVSWLSYTALIFLNIDPSLSNAISWAIAASFAFVMNKLFVFLSKSTDKKTVGWEMLTFAFARIFSGVVTIVLFPILYDLGMNQHLLGVDGLLAKIVVTVIEVALNYLFSKYIVFIKK